MKLNKEKKVEDLTFEGSGCAISIASTSIMTELVKGKTFEETKQLGIFEVNKKKIKIIEWPELLKDSIQDKLEINFKYAEHENERNISLSCYGKWKDFKINAI